MCVPVYAHWRMWQVVSLEVRLQWFEAGQEGPGALAVCTLSASVRGMLINQVYGLWGWHRDWFGSW